MMCAVISEKQIQKDVKGSELQNWLWHGGSEGNQKTVYFVTHPLFELGTF
jgi:hypothetical protein